MGTDQGHAEGADWAEMTMTEDQKQKYFEQGYDQCFREVIEEIESWKHPDRKSFVMWLKGVFKSSAEAMEKRK